MRLQAYVFKHRAGRNVGWFAPDKMRDIGPTEKVGMEQQAFAKLEGLGKIPFSNIRRPRPLMDLEPPKQPKEEEVCLLYAFCTMRYSTESRLHASSQLLHHLQNLI